MNRQLQLARNRVYEALNHRLRGLAGGRFNSLCRPTWISCLLTELCNARCVHCDIWRNKGRETGPNENDWKVLLLDLRRWLGPVHVCLTGGEALLKPYTIDLVRSASQSGLLLEILTHGYWADQGKIEQLVNANPWRLTVSLDGLGETHTKIRGRDGFWEKTSATIETMVRVRAATRLPVSILLKTVVMSHNIHDLVPLAEYAREKGVEIMYQAIEQNYNTPEDERWWEHTDNWPIDPEAAVREVNRLIALKNKGFPILNGIHQLEVMIPYFRHPEASRVMIQGHTAHEQRAQCAALGLLQLHANGDVRTCANAQPVGNFLETPIRRIWEERPQWWHGGCCLERRCSQAEKEKFGLVRIST